MLLKGTLPAGNAKQKVGRGPDLNETAQDHNCVCVCLPMFVPSGVGRVVQPVKASRER